MGSKTEKTKRKQLAVRSKIKKEGFRLSIFRSNRYLFAQVIDQINGATVIGLTDKQLLVEKTNKKTKIEKARQFGSAFSKLVLEKKIKKVSFDRGQYIFHGRVKAFVEGLREGGLEF